MLFLIAKHLTTHCRPPQRQKLLLISFLTSFCLLSLFFGRYHQVGTLSVVQQIGTEAHKDKNMSVLFLTPCHSTPLYSHIRQNITTKFLTCEPPIMGNVVEEVEEFFNAPIVWLDQYWLKTRIKPTHIVIFDSLLPSIQSWLELKSYHTTHAFFHTFLPDNRVSENILLLERRKLIYDLV